MRLSSAPSSKSVSVTITRFIKLLTRQADAGGVGDGEGLFLRVEPAQTGNNTHRWSTISLWPPPPQWVDDVTTDLMTGTSGPKVSSFMHSMSVVTSASRVGSTKEPPTRFPPRSTFAPRDTASDICCATCRTQRLSEGKLVEAAR